MRVFVTSLLISLFSWSSLLAEEPYMYAHYIDVGQANSILLEFPCGAVLIDAGAQDEAHADHLTYKLREFFADREHLNNTLDALIITHPHIDHTRVLPRVTEVCRVRNYIDNGKTTGSGRYPVRWIRDQMQDGLLMTNLREIEDTEITGLSHRNGLTDDAIDPISCDDCDPQIKILSGGHTRNPGWSRSAYNQLNNHSVVVRVDFGESSFLFTGDLEEEGIELLTGYYEGTDMLDVDVYEIGHHGSSNGTTEELLEAMSPDIAVFSVGRYDFGRDPYDPYSTYVYGHPRLDVLRMIENNISGTRSEPIQANIFTGQRRYHERTISKRIYATAWDGDITIRADLEGNMRVTKRHWPRSRPWDYVSPFDFQPSPNEPRPEPSPPERSLEPFDFTNSLSQTPPYDSVTEEAAPELRSVTVCSSTYKSCRKAKVRFRCGFRNRRSIRRCR